MEKPKIIVDDFWCEGYLLPLDYHRLLCKEIIGHHRSIEFPNQSFAGIIGMRHISSHCLALTTAGIPVPSNPQYQHLALIE
ncbi:hypothetical protein ACOSQ4_027136 [Xanthoceras sorbifolium]